MAGSRMHQTTVRFGAELWGRLEIEAARSGVSVAHYVREAALARLAYRAGDRAGRQATDSFAWADGRPPDDRTARIHDQVDDTSAPRASTRRARAVRDRADAESTR